MLLRLSDAYRKNPDPHSMSARAIGHEIQSSYNSLCLIGAIKGNAGILHIAEWNTTSV